MQHLYFKRFIAFLVLLNSFLLCVKWEEDAPDSRDDVLESRKGAEDIMLEATVASNVTAQGG